MTESQSNTGKLRIGVDVGGTNTDAVVMAGVTVLGAVKTPTTTDLTTGVQNALRKVIEAAGIDAHAVGHVMIGTTVFTNAVIERKHLVPVAAIRLGLPATACLPPMVDWPDDMRMAVGNHAYMLKGGYDFDGQIFAELDEKELDIIATEMKEKQLGIAAITSIFGPVRGDMEERARDLLLKRLPNLKVVLSKDIGQLGLLERESATILNAALLELADSTVRSFQNAIEELHLTCGFSITQNDGTLISADKVRHFPVLTFASGPTNSMRGAAFLTGLKDAIVIDIGGTTSDIGALSKGFPRQATTVTDIGGVRTNFRMPDVVAIGLGGGSIVAKDLQSVGPKSVGHRIVEEGLAFGGQTMTATDIAVRLGHVDIGDADLVSDLTRSNADALCANIHETLSRAVERCRVSSDPIPVIGVGGGAFLLPDQLGGLQVVTPPHSAVANAVGAAIAQVSGEVDRIFELGNMTREDGLAIAEEEARREAIAAGAQPDTIQIMEREDVPLAYLPGNATRIRVRVVGDIGSF